MGFIDIFRISKIKAENEQLKAEKQALTEKLASLGADDLLHARTKLSESNQEIADNNITLSRLRSEIADLSEKMQNPKGNWLPTPESYREQRNYTRAWKMPWIIFWFLICHIQIVVFPYRILMMLN